MIDERAHELGPGRPLLYAGGVVRVIVLCVGKKREKKDREQDRQNILFNMNKAPGEAHISHDARFYGATAELWLGLFVKLHT